MVASLLSFLKTFGDMTRDAQHIHHLINLFQHTTMDCNLSVLKNELSINLHGAIRPGKKHYGHRSEMMGLQGTFSAEVLGQLSRRIHNYILR